MDTKQEKQKAGKHSAEFSSTLKQPVSIKELLQAGAHFGHQTKRWNPKMKRYIFEERNGLYIIDLAKTMQQIRDAIEVVTDVVSRGKSVLFVGTKKQAKEAVKQVAEEAGEFYVCERWLGGLMTNLVTIRASVAKLEKFEKTLASAELTKDLKKKEIVMMSRDLEKLERNLSGVRSMRRTPGLVVVVDPGKEHIAVAEANKLGIPVMALVDTNCDPDPIQHVIACNDDALKSIKLILDAIGGAIIEAKNKSHVGAMKGDIETSKKS